MLESDKEECAIDESTLILGDSCGAIDYECDNKDDDAETDMLKKYNICESNEDSNFNVNKDKIIELDQYECQWESDDSNVETDDNWATDSDEDSRGEFELGCNRSSM